METRGSRGMKEALSHVRADDEAHLHFYARGFSEKCDVVRGEQVHAVSYG